MKEIFDWLSNKIVTSSYETETLGGRYINVVQEKRCLELVDEAEARWKEKKEELRANVIEEFAEKLKREEVYVDVTSDDMVYVKYCRYIDEIASQMKGEKK